MCDGNRYGAMTGDNEPDKRQLHGVRDRSQMNRKEENSYVNVRWFR